MISPNDGLPCPSFDLREAFDIEENFVSAFLFDFGVPEFDIPFGDKTPPLTDTKSAKSKYDFHSTKRFKKSPKILNIKPPTIVNTVKFFIQHRLQTWTRIRQT